MCGSTSISVVQDQSTIDALSQCKPLTSCFPHRNTETTGQGVRVLRAGEEEIPLTSCFVCKLRDFEKQVKNLQKRHMKLSGCVLRRQRGGPWPNMIDTLPLSVHNAPLTRLVSFCLHSETVQNREEKYTEWPCSYRRGLDPSCVHFVIRFSSHTFRVSHFVFFQLRNLKNFRN